MSFPTTLSPWYVVQRITSRDEMEYYRSDLAAPEESATFTNKRAFAMLFMNLQSAARVADAEAAEVRVLYSKDHAKEFGR